MYSAYGEEVIVRLLLQLLAPSRSRHPFPVSLSPFIALLFIIRTQLLAGLHGVHRRTWQ